MVITLQIDKIEPGLYRAAVLSGGIEVTEPSMHTSIVEAIREVASDVPDGFAHFAVVMYGSACSGTIALKDVPEKAAQIADQLVSIVADMRQIVGINENEPQVSLRLTKEELQALVAYTHEANCQGDLQLSTSEAGIGTTLTITCTKNCTAPKNITDYSCW
ncbi:hypothetical protein HUU62_02305 [Rhodoferax sp. 4810]|nr:hypothetical protein [Rhodoferax jenense]